MLYYLKIHIHDVKIKLMMYSLEVTEIHVLLKMGAGIGGGARRACICLPLRKMFTLHC